MAHFLCHLGCSHFGALLLDFYFTENTIMTYFKIIMHLPSTTRNKTDKNAIRMKALSVWAARRDALY